ncbi:MULTISPECIES: NmrA family NAD(P)-binding protein [unclassified Sphingopyxis]|uniref:NmrA family NAD(P)-binding protein n=1 Tax=unclassified Sphingopyxis TaxID=2614943 RepID=UPI001910B9A3|nr:MULTISPECIES: NAD(P)H-binding protein [unclassified Sphingopyxis]
MHIVMGATGHVGSAVAETLLALGEPVGIITHDPEHADSWRDTKAEIIEADVNDVPSLRAAFQRGRRLLAQSARRHKHGHRQRGAEHRR